MRKLLLLSTFIIIFLAAFSQKSESLWEIELVTGAAPSTVNVPINGDISLVRVYSDGSVSPSSDVTIIANGTPSYPMTIEGVYCATISSESHSRAISFFGVEIPSEMLNDTVYMRSSWTGSAWETTIHPNMGAVGSIPIWNIDTSGFDGTTIELDPSSGLQVMDNGITMDKIESIPAGQVIGGDTGGDPAMITIGGDLAMDGSGTMTLQNATVDEANIVDEAVTLEKIADISEGSIIQGGTGDRPEELDISAAGYIPIGNGTKAVSVAMSGDITISSAGVTAIGADAITGPEIADGAIAIEKLETGTSGQIVVANSSGVPTLMSISGDIDISGTGAATIAAATISNTQLEGGITSDKMYIDYNAGTWGGVLCQQVIEPTYLKAALTGSETPIFLLSEGSIITNVRVAVQTATGTACTLKIGYNIDGVPLWQDDDGLMKSVNLNSDAWYEASNVTYCGDSMLSGAFQNNGGDDLEITVTPSVDASSTSLVATIVITYIEGGGYAAP